MINYLKQIRKNKKIGAEEIATAIGVSPQLIWKFERGDGELSLYNLIKVSNFLEVSTDEILKGEQARIQKTEYPIKKQLLAYSMEIMDESFKENLEELTKEERINLIDFVYNLVYEHFEKKEEGVIAKIEHKVQVEKGLVNLIKKYGTG